MAIQKLENRKNIRINKNAKSKSIQLKNKNKPKPLRTLTSEKKYQLQKLRFRAWKADQFVIDNLKKRGWHYVGEPKKNGRYGYPKCMYDARKKNKLDKKDCLVLGDDDCGLIYAGYSDKVVCSVIPNSHRAEAKVEQQKMFQNYKWFPQCYTLPREKNDLKKKIKDSKKRTFWICKPARGYGGFGLKVYNGESKEFRKLFKRKCDFVIQRYVSDPYLMAGIYKFHIRCYLLISNIEPLKAYLYKDGQVLFATVPYDLNKVGDKFNKYSHITNYKISNEKKNRENMYANKPGIGIGTEWTTKEFFKYLSKNEPKWNKTKFWLDLSKISKVIAEKIVSNHYVKKGLENYNVENHYELFGLDVMMNKNFELSISEWNTQPGLEYMKERMDNGVYNPHIVASNKISQGVVHDVMTKIGIDNVKSYQGKWIKLIF